MKKLALIAPLFLLVACERASFDGQMSVSNSFQIDGKKKSITVPAGKHEVKFSVNKKTFELKIEGDPDTKVKFAIPSNVRLPQYDGHVFMAASELEQDFDMEGEVRTDVSHSPLQTRTESCSVKVGTRHVCHEVPGPVVCHEINGRQECHQTAPQRVCEWQDIYRYGYQEITYHIQTSQTDLNLDFKVPGSEQVLAHIDGASDVRRAEIIDRQTSCIIDHVRPF